MQFRGEFRVPGDPADVLRRFADVERMASCMPGASIEGRNEDGSYRGAMLVAFGPKKIRFRGRVTFDTDETTLTGGMHVRGAADLRTPASVELRVKYSLRNDPGAPQPTAIVALTSEGEMGGVLADFARTGGVAVTQALMEEFAARAALEFARDAAPAAGQTQAADDLADLPTDTVAAPRANDTAAPQASQVQPQPAALSVHRLLWRIIRDRLAAWFRRLGLRP